MTRQLREPLYIPAVAAVLLLTLAACAGSTPLVDDVQNVQVSDDGRVLTVTVLHGRCEEGTRRFTLTETAQEVRLRSDGARALTGDCNDIGLMTELTGRLDRPLGTRVLVDDSDDAAVEPS